MQVDLGGKLVVPQEMVCTSLRSDIILWLVSQKIVYFIKLTQWKKPIKGKSLNTQTWGQKLSSEGGKLRFVQWKGDVGVS